MRSKYVTAALSQQKVNSKAQFLEAEVTKRCADYVEKIAASGGKGCAFCAGPHWMFAKLSGDCECNELKKRGVKKRPAKFINEVRIEADESNDIDAEQFESYGNPSLFDTEQFECT